MKILFLAHRIPYPPNKGDKIRSFNEIKYLSQSHEIYLGTTLDAESDREHLAELSFFCKQVYGVYFNKTISLAKGLLYRRPLSVSHFYRDELQQFVNQTLLQNRIDVVVCFCSSMAEYVFRSPIFDGKMQYKPKLIMDFVDVDSDKWLQYARYSSFPRSYVYRIENLRLSSYEARIARSFDHSIFVCQREVDVFKKLYPATANFHVIPNGVDYEYFSAPARTEDNPRDSVFKTGPVLVFTGFMDYFANEDGAKWFCEDIFPRVKKIFPKARFCIVGNKPTNIVWSLSEMDGVVVTGYVDDIREFYWMADICVIPLRIARGLQNKVLEAMATGNAVVATPNASEGIICHDNSDILIAKDEQPFADAIIRLLQDEGARKEMGRKAAVNIRTHYCWEENLKAFEHLLR